MPKNLPIKEGILGVYYAYQNGVSVADIISPRHSVPSIHFKKWTYGEDTRFQAPETKVGKDGQLHEMEFGGILTKDKCDDHGLQSWINLAELEERGGRKELQKEIGSELVNLKHARLLRRELEVSNQANDINNYDANLVTGIANKVNDEASNALTVLEEKMNECLTRPNVVVIPDYVWTPFRKNKTFIKEINGENGKAITVADLKEFLKVEHVVIPSSRMNTAKRGAAPVLERIWQDSIIACYAETNRSPESEGVMSWSWTPEYGEEIGKADEHDDRGLRGMVKIRSGKTMKNGVIQAKKAACMLTDVL